MLNASTETIQFTQHLCGTVGVAFTVSDGGTSAVDTVTTPTSTQTAVATALTTSRITAPSGNGTGTVSTATSSRASPSSTAASDAVRTTPWFGGIVAVLLLKGFFRFV